MRMGYVISGEGVNRRKVAVDDLLVIGRSGDCGLVLGDAAASRRHLEIRPTPKGFECRDLGSRNGTKVNNRDITEAILEHGDLIRIGQSTIRFIVADEAGRTAPDRTVFMPTVLDAKGKEQVESSDSRSKQLLETAYTLMNAIATNFDPCDLAQCILGITSKAIQGRRAAIFYADDLGELSPCPACGAVHSVWDGIPESISVDRIQISETIARRVLTKGENVLYRSARSDSTVDTTVSMLALNLTSILCVPIRTQNRILGILYIDTDVTNRVYTHDDLLLAAAAGNSAGLALENARIHQSLLERNRVDQEIADAWTIQEGFLVRDWPTGDPRFDVYGETRPAKTVGGDFYDFVQLDEHTVGILIGDVSGKGIPAALTMAQLLAEFRLCATADRSPARVVARINGAMVIRSRRGTFCSMVYAIVDLKNGNLIGANAGHHPMLVVSPGSVSQRLEPSGPPIGILLDAAWQDEAGTVQPGESLVLYTDGIVEARSGTTQTALDAQPEQYRLFRLQQIAGRHAAGKPRDLVAAILADVDDFCGAFRPHDDCTMIALRYHGDG